MKDFFAFRLMITAGLVKVLYPMGAIGIVMGLFFMVPKQNAVASAVAMDWPKALLLLLFAQIGWRIFCEQMILLFAIHEGLTRKNAGSPKD